MKIEEIKDFIEKNTWTWAKSYRNIPHQWIIRPNVKEKFDDFIQVIREKGVKAKFFKREYTYFEFEGYFYWVMNSLTEKDFIINRASTETYELRNINGTLYMYKK